MPRRASRTVNARIHRLAGQLLAIEKMLTARRNCSEVLNQIGAVRAGLEQVSVIVLQKELQRTQLRNGSPEKIAQLLKSFSKSQ